MALYFQKNEIEFERTGVTANVPNNDVARLMYYLNCVCVAIDCDNDPDIQRFTSYSNWSRLSTEEQKALIRVCYSFSPDVLNNRVFFHSDVLCGDNSNEFYTINQVRHQVAAAESIIIAGRVRVVNKIMTYTMQWLETYYVDPMLRLVRQLGASSERPTPTYTPTVVRQPVYTKKSSNKCKWICGFIVAVIIIVVIIIIIISATAK
jgi:hypothetical protein